MTLDTLGAAAIGPAGLPVSERSPAPTRSGAHVLMRRTTLLLGALLACTAPSETPAPAQIVDPAPPPIVAPTAEPPRESPRPRLPIVPDDCDAPAPAHTLTIDAAAIDLDGTPYPDIAALTTALSAIHGEPLALAFAAGMTRKQLDPLLTALARLTPRPPLRVRVASADPFAGPRHIPIAGIDIDPDPTFTPAYSLTLIGARTRLVDLVDASRKVPDDLSLAGLPVLVTASDLTPWDAIAAALARACGGARLVETVRGARVPTVTRSVAGPTTGYAHIDTLRRIVRANIRDVRTCYDDARVRDPQARGRVAIRFSISDAGKITDAFVLETNMKDPKVGQCLAAAVRRWKFPKPELGAATLTYPFVLEPG